jgi:O-antigen/teichoic acid export membrane protein
MRNKALLVFCSTVMQRLSMLVMTIVAAQTIGANELGKFAMVYATCVNLTGFIGDALAATINQRVASAVDQPVQVRYEIAGMILSFCVLVALGFGIIVLLCAPLISIFVSGSTELATYISVAGLMTIFLLPNTVMNALLNVFGRNLVAALVASAGAVTSVLFGLSGAYYHGAFGMCVGFATGTILLSVMYLVVLKYQFLQTFLGFDNVRKYFASSVFSSFTFPTMATLALGGPVHWLCMSFLGSSTSGMRQIAIFTAMFQWYSILTFIPGALLNFSIPLLASAKAHSETFFRLRSLQVIMAVTMVVGVLMVLIVSLKSYILALYGSDFATEASVLVLLAVCGFLAALIAVMNQISWAVGKTWSSLVAAFSYGTVYVISAYVFIEVLHFGASGLGWSILIASLFQCSLQIHFYFAQEKKK